MADANDYSSLFNTQLDPATEKAFVDWATQNNRMNDLFDYDLRGAFKAGLTGKSGHLPDTFKKPNHPTFSDESMYSTGTLRGGSWVKNGNKWTFKASPTNLQFHSADGLSDYFRRVEPGNTLVLPQ